ncbi:hypothetical protein FOCC_FOCC002541 [Frankliniella occidentalis]|uniref:Uncharacterized protein LOC113205325 n=1 Tax=Frankliniella occidentalis TaxID=133901 RepID=A0A6J1S648_FRAOC|nr:uncharacterized protein LOC113205325 [Frankliniella occidentalis]KAE8750830.1 hypothetical protein FOCC_FOCC002541 [Frankliniella occidentalis]
MAFNCFVSLLFLLAVASATEDFTKQVKDAELLGDSIPKLLEKQWSSKLAQQKKNLSSAEEALVKTLPNLVKTEVIAQLNEVEQKLEAELSTFVKLQLKQASEISTKYKSFLNQRLSAKGAAATDETSIHKIREESQKIVNSWEPALSKIHESAHQKFESAVRSIAEKISKTQTQTPQMADQVRVAITNVGVQLLNVLIQEQNADTHLLTSVQFNLYNTFFQKAETVLIQLLVSAKSSSSSSAASPSAPGTGSQPASQNDSHKVSQDVSQKGSQKISPSSSKGGSQSPARLSPGGETKTTGQTSAEEEEEDCDYAEYE